MSSTNDLYISPQLTDLDNLGDFTPDLDYLDQDTSFDFDNADLGGDMIGDLPDFDQLHEKRKSPDENADAEKGDAKRQEVQDGEKTAKKPGRKPLTNEPTTKRKAQNRAAQRAFRERKEQHLKDLETKVADLTKESEEDKHEKSLLRAQVDKLQTELREYRKRLSLNGAGGQSNRSPTLGGFTQRSNSGSNYGPNQFAFDFPRFGTFADNAFPARPQQNDGVIKRESLTPPTAGSSRHNSQSQSLSPPALQHLSNSLGTPSSINSNANVGYSTVNNMHGFASTLPQMNETSPFGDLFSPSILKDAALTDGNYFGTTNTGLMQAGTTVSDGGDSSAGFNRAFQFNGGNLSDSASPSGSSMSQWQGNGTTSSCGTSPEPSHGSPANKDNLGDKGSQLKTSTTQAELPNTTSIFGNSDFTVPSSTTFDPALFGDYRDTTGDNLFGSTTFGNGFFDDSFASAPFDMGSPSNLFGILQSPASNNNPSQATPSNPKPSEELMANVEKARTADEDYGSSAGLPNQSSEKKLISCNNIWNQLQSNPEFQNGTFDLDDLCSELRTKARCSESGVMVDKDHVDAALRKIGNKNLSPKDYTGSKMLMFEQETWDSVLKKMNDNGQKL